MSVKVLTFLISGWGPHHHYHLVGSIGVPHRGVLYGPKKLNSLSMGKLASHAYCSSYRTHQTTLSPCQNRTPIPVRTL